MTQEEYRQLEQWYFKDKHWLIQCTKLFRLKYWRAIWQEKIKRRFKENWLSIRSKWSQSVFWDDEIVSKAIKLIKEWRTAKQIQKDLSISWPSVYKIAKSNWLQFTKTITTKDICKSLDQHKRDLDKWNTFIIEEYKKLKKSLKWVTDLSVRAELVLEYNYTIWFN